MKDLRALIEQAEKMCVTCEKSVAQFKDLPALRKKIEELKVRESALYKARADLRDSLREMCGLPHGWLSPSQLGSVIGRALGEYEPRER